MPPISLPPWARSRAALGLTAGAALGRFDLQICASCGAAQYPPREACHVCLSVAFTRQAQQAGGELIAETTLHHSNDAYFRDRLPWRLGLVRLDLGPTAVVHLHGRCGSAPSRVRVSARLDQSGQGVLVAYPPLETLNMTDDRQLREMTCDPKSRNILVTDGQTAVGQALVRALIEAEAATVWVGSAAPARSNPGIDAIAALPQVSVIPLDVTDSTCIQRQAQAIGEKIDILINNAEVHCAHGIASHSGVEEARAEMDVNYFGLLRLAQQFGPALRTRASKQSRACGWVNLLSVYALSNFPAHGTFSASKAAALSLSQCLRAEMLSAGTRVINVFPGPLEDERTQSHSPNLSAPALAQAVIGALRDAVEDVYPGELAQEWWARFNESPKILERELAATVR